MKHKAIPRIFAVLLAALLLTGGLSVTAHAEIPTETPTDDSGVKVDPKPLTPEGNMTLVDDIQGDAAKDKQFIVVQSRAVRISTSLSTTPPRVKTASTS